MGASRGCPDPKSGSHGAYGRVNFVRVAKSVHFADTRAMGFPRKTPSIHTVGGRLKIARQAARMSSSQLATKLHCSKFTLNSYEMGKRRVPIDLLRRAAKYTSTSYYWLLMRSDEGEPPLLHTVEYDATPPSSDELPPQARLRDREPVAL